MLTRTGRILGALSLLLTAPGSAFAQDLPEPRASSQELPAAAAKPAAAPYSLPWQLRSVVVGNVVRSDTTLALYDGGSTTASMLLGSFKVTGELAPLLRLGVVANSPPEPLDSAVSFVNPVVGATYAPRLPAPFKLAAFVGLALPVGMGGGDSPDGDVAAASSSGVLARSAMDNAMFAVNYLTVFPGLGFAYVADGFTAQVEVTLLQLTRTRGPDTQDSSRTNFTSGLHVGYFVLPELSLGAELRHQRWLSTPNFLTDALGNRDTTTVAAGPRAHLELGEKIWFRPGVSFALPLDEPMSASDYKIVQLDLPLAF